MEVCEQFFKIIATKHLKGSVKELNMFHNYKLRKSPIKPATRQKTCNYIELFGSSAQDRHVILCMSADICIMHDDLRRKNQTTRYICSFSAASLALRVIFFCGKRPPIYAFCTTISGGRTKQHVVIGFGELAAVD